MTAGELSRRRTCGRCYISAGANHRYPSLKAKMLLPHPVLAQNADHNISITYATMFHACSVTTVQLGLGRVRELPPLGVPPAGPFSIRLST